MIPLATESDLGQAFAQAVPFALPHVRVFRRNILNVETAQGWRARAGIKGQADYYAIVRGGRVVELETKAAKAKWYAEQEAWRAFCQSFEIPYLVLRAKPKELPAETVARWVDELRAVAPC
jgi:hypothetical protein